MIVLACFLTLASTRLSAQEVPSEMKTLDPFIGKWRAPAATLRAEGRPFTIDFRMEFKRGCNGHCITVEEWFDHTELGSFRSSSVIGYDPYGKKVHISTVDNFGTAHDHVGSWKGKDHFHFDHSSKRNGKKYVEKGDIYFSGNTARLSLRGTLGGKELERVEAVLEKQP
jgi:hypothetical protein